MLEDWLRRPGQEVWGRGNAWDQFWAGEHLLMAGDVEAARQRFAAVDPSVREVAPYVALYQAMIQAGAGDFRGASWRLGQLAAIDPEFVRGYSTLGRAFERMGKLDEAAFLYRQLGAYGGQWAADGHYELGKLYFNQGDFDRAAEHYAQLVAHKPKANIHRSYLADARLAQGRDREAFSLYRELWRADDLRLQFFNRNYLPNFIRASHAVGDGARARELLEVLERVDPDNQQSTAVRALVSSMP